MSSDGWASSAEKLDRYEQVRTLVERAFPEPHDAVEEVVRDAFELGFMEGAIAIARICPDMDIPEDGLRRLVESIVQKKAVW